MLPNRETLLCRYAYDPLDRLVDCTPSAQAATQRFYMKDRLATETQDAVQRSIMQHNDQLLAQQQRQGSSTTVTSLLATDQQRSVLNVLDTTRLNPLAYTPYGHRLATNGLLSLLGFNGERPDPVDWVLFVGKWLSGVQSDVDAVQQPGQLESVWGGRTECVCVLLRGSGEQNRSHRTFLEVFSAFIWTVQSGCT